MDSEGDGIDEIFLTASTFYCVKNYQFFAVFDFNSDSFEWKTSEEDLEPGKAFAHGDMNNDGHNDSIVLTPNGFIYAYDAWNEVLIGKSPKLLFPGNDIDAADLNRDGVLEIIALSYDTLYL